MNLPQIIRQARKAKGLTLDQIAKHLGYSHRSNAQRIESGQIALKAEDLIKLAALLDLDLNSLVNSSE